MNFTYIIVALCAISLYYYHKFNDRISLIVPHIRKHDRVLDLGCGDCCITKKLIKTGVNAVGVDVVDAGKCYIPKLYDGYTLHYPNDHFDVTICSYVLHHIPHWDIILKEVGRATKRVIIILEDTPETGTDRFFCGLHAGSGWGGCPRCFRTASEWMTTFRKMTHKSVHHTRISRFTFPFAMCPWFYPVPRALFVVELS